MTPTSAPPHLWGRIRLDVKDHGSYETEWCQRCGCLRGREFGPADAFMDTPKATQYRQPDGPWQDEAVACRPASPPISPAPTWPVAVLFEPAESTRGRKTVIHDASYLSLSPVACEVANCWADCPDGKRRLVRVHVNPQALVEWATANLPHDARLTTGNRDIGVWSTTEVRE